jgi:hypothetical protein
MPEDFREQRKKRQEQAAPPPQGIVVPENVYGISLPGREETVPPANGETVIEPTEDQVVKTSFYPRQDQLDKLDDLAGEYNKRYRRQRKRIDRQDIIRFLIDRCTSLDSLEDLKL